jgi:LEA14-like dessication related protein
MHLMKNTIRFISVALPVLFFPGCVGLGKRLEPPRVHIADIRGQEMKALESIFHLELRIFNTNDVPVTIKGIDCELMINDRRFASGVSNKEATIPSFSTKLMPIVVYSSVLDVFKGLIGLQGKDKIGYRLQGKVHLSADDRIPSVLPFKSEGQLTFDGIAGST